MRRLLAAQFGRLDLGYEALDPLTQLVRSLIGSRTQDTISQFAFERLRAAYGNWHSLAKASTLDIKRLLAGVTYADRKARQLRASLILLFTGEEQGHLSCLDKMTIEQAQKWLERLPGVGSKVSAAVLNFSTMNRRAFVADTHVLRVFRRYGLIDARTGARAVHAMIVAAMTEWSAEEFLELHALVKRLGQTFCQFRQTDCPGCPLRARCQSFVRSAIPS